MNCNFGWLLFSGFNEQVTEFKQAPADFLICIGRPMNVLSAVVVIAELTPPTEPSESSTGGLLHSCRLQGLSVGL